MSAQYGSQIGNKFHEDGTAAKYPGNTVIADVCVGNPAYDVMAKCLDMLKEADLDENFIHLPKDSYHMTVIRGVNDKVRTDDFWPAALPKEMPFEQVDAYMYKAVQRVPGIGKIRMCFDEAVITQEDFRIRLKPADEAQMALLRSYRDQVADAVGLRLPGHDTYTYHMTLAYTWRLPDVQQQNALTKLVEKMNAYLAEQPEALIDEAHFAWYRDMLSFHDQPIRRT